MIRRIETAPGLAPSIGPYSQAVVANGFVFTTGQVPFAADGITPEAFEDQVRTCLGNLRSVLDTAGSSIDQVVKVNAYLTAPEQREPFNRVYADFFGEAKPARTTVCVSIWDISLEVECVAVVSESSEAAGGA
ncbi:RidA family protein [Brevibacterium aurantiacum]|uniref:2-iminobutanoate/2-iminopropanoate deaminase n=1 Tax=Brevibacterium aurantiacum TaxID=273384 RepID=A0A2H1JY74_BREAU|nr:RidA family protein [Brevibacterium aurantiacum]TGD38678.1 RidA family protein [Brevibacterium aurantiacum]GEB24203.1 reactive intermediate/imine deaminase [Brevibacterium aurantiacum]SMX92413.1 2-iminobutanoate/2-iminopropanoate deaminase [Brevibacterium aurantiacum]